MSYNLQNKRILVTGAAGFIGANLTRELVRVGANVSVIIRASTNLWRISEIVPRLNLCMADLTDFITMEEIIKQLKPEIIFNLAITYGHPSKFQEQMDMLKTSVIGTANLLEALKPVGFERFIQLGSSLEYGIKKKPLKETDPAAPSTFRGDVKVAATLLCQQFAEANSRSVVVLRPFSVYGFWEAHTRLIPTAIMASLNKSEINLTPPGFKRDLVFISDVVEACLLSACADRIDGEIINIGTGQQRTNEEVVNMIQALTGSKIQVNMGKHLHSPSDTVNWVADIRRAKQLLGWEPRNTLEMGLEKTISWFRNHHNEYRK